MPFIDPVTLQEALDLYIEGMPIEDISNLLMVDPDDINAALDNILPFL